MHGGASSRPDHDGAPEPSGAAWTSAALLALKHLPAVVFVKDAQTGRYLFVSAASRGALGREPSAVVGRTDGELFGAVDQGWAEQDRAAAAGEAVRPYEGSFEGENGRTAILRSWRRLAEPLGNGRYIIGSLVDVTDARAAQDRALWRAQHDGLTRLVNRERCVELLQALLHDGRCAAILSIDLDHFKAVNDRLGHLAGDAVLTEVADRLRALLSPGDVLARVGGDELVLIVVDDAPAARAESVARAVLASLAAPFAIGTATAQVGASIGIALAPGDGRTVEELRRHADVALYRVKQEGRGGFCFVHGSPEPFRHADGFVDRRQEPAGSLADRLAVESAPGSAILPSHKLVAIADLDRFAGLRQRIGYTLANALVNELAQRLRKELPQCQIGRIGRTSVEFAFAAPSAAEGSASLSAALTALERPFLIQGCPFDLTVTIGAVDAGDQLIDDEQLDGAAAALATAQARREKLHVAEATLRERDEFDQLAVIRDLRAAITAGGLALHYQPKLRSRTESVDSAEALLRWVHPELGLVRTDKLIALAEATGAIRELTLWAVDRALADRARFAAAGHPLTVFVNISGVLLADAGFADWALQRLASVPGAIGFEITETAVIDDPAVAIGHLQRFAAAGIKIAIDDYGSGLSSLAYLKQLPAHELKIDRMFVSGLTESHRDPLLVRSSIDLAHALEMEVTAEGVDDPISLSLLRVMGCDLIQGYLVSPPLAADELVTFLSEQHYKARLSAAVPSLHGWTLAAGAGEQR